MKIYLVYTTTRDGILEIFSTKEKAQSFMREYFVENFGENKHIEILKEFDMRIQFVDKEFFVYDEISIEEKEIG